MQNFIACLCVLFTFTNELILILSKQRKLESTCEVLLNVFSQFSFFYTCYD